MVPLSREECLNVLLFARAAMVMQWEPEEDILLRMQEKGLEGAFSLVMTGHDPETALNRYLNFEQGS